MGMNIGGHVEKSQLSRGRWDIGEPQAVDAAGSLQFLDLTTYRDSLLRSE
jgi:hypothetical protein